uniref:Uncharacterized protein n=1 Tax=Meloidogyne enterolobii TaxID=390850 RepID=A0A6V7UFU2_MELEN|nr:unnamed protein product [Meloidogyne enterolobii]
MSVRFNETMKMPNITFCMSREQAWSHFKLNSTENKQLWDKTIATQLANMTKKEDFLSKQWDYRIVMETYNLISTLTSMERETTAHGTVASIEKYNTQSRLEEIRKLSKFWLGEIQKRQVSFEEFVQKVGKETLRRSLQRFQRTTYDEDEVISTQLKITWLSQVQLCFQPTFDEANYKTIDDQGQFFVMSLSHNSENLDGEQIDCMTADFHGRPSSTSRFMGSKGITKDGFTDELCLGMMHETTVDVKARYKMLPNKEEGTACADLEDDNADTEWDCHLRCRLEFIRNLCQCTAPTLSYLIGPDKEEKELKEWPICDYGKCKVDVQGRNYSDEDCTKKCFRSCDQIRYNIDHERKGKSMRPDLTTVVLKWDSFEYLTMEQDWVWSVTTFIAALGGSIGMWLGLSILSLIQGSTYLLTYIEQRVAKRKINKMGENEQETPPSKPTKNQLQDDNNKRKYSKTSTTTSLEENKLAANPFASPFNKKTNQK